MKIRTRLVVALIAIAITLVIPLLMALRSLDRVHAATEELRDREFAASLLLARIRSGTEELRRAETALLFVHDSISREKMEAALGALRSMADSLDYYALDSAAANVRRAVADIAADAPREYQAALDGRLAEAESISTQRIVPAIARVERWSEAAAASLQQRTRQRVAETAEATGGARRAAMVLMFTALLLTLAIAVWITRSISRPVRELERGMRAIAGGKFDYRLGTSLDRSDEFGRLAAGLTSMASQLAELDKLKAEFVSIASHELKTPLNVILGYLQLLREGVYGTLGPKQDEIVGTIETQAQTLSRLVRQLLDVSRFEAGGGRIEPREFELCGFFADLENAFRVLARQREVDFEVRCAESLPERVAWDRDRISEVLGNLLTNAFKFTESGGRVELSAEAVDDRSVLIEVADTGAGIPASQLPYVFKKFYQAGNQSRSDGLGTGLGLAITKEIVEAHRGTITVESTPGVGTVFTIILPSSPDAPRSDQSPQATLQTSR